MIKSVIKWKYKSLIITNFGSESQFTRNSTNFSLQILQKLKNIQEQNWAKLLQFSIKSCDSFCFFLQSSSSWTVLRKLCKRTSHSWLSKACAFMEFGDFLQLRHCWATTTVPITFLDVDLHLFHTNQSWNARNLTLPSQGTRNSNLMILWKSIGVLKFIPCR